MAWVGNIAVSVRQWAAKGTRLDIVTRPTQTLLLTRPRDASERFAQALRAEGLGRHRMIISPLIEIQAVGNPINLDGFGAVIFTSSNAVKTAKWANPVSRMLAFCVGDRTAQMAGNAGFDPISAGGDSKNLVDLILSHQPRYSMIHLSGEDTVGDIEHKLEASGVKCAKQVVYCQVAEPLTSVAMAALTGDGRVIVPLFSPNTARALVTQGPYSAPIETIAMSQAVENILADLPRIRGMIAQAPHQNAMVRAISSTLGGN